MIRAEELLGETAKWAHQTQEGYTLRFVQESGLTQGEQTLRFYYSSFYSRMPFYDLSRKTTVPPDFAIHQDIQWPLHFRGRGSIHIRK